MMEQALTFLIAACVLSLGALILPGGVARRRRRAAGVAFHAVVAGLAALLVPVGGGPLGLAIVLGGLYFAAARLLREALPDWNAVGQAFFAAFAGAQALFLARIFQAVFFGPLTALVRAGSIVLFAAELLVVLITLYFTFELLDVTCRVRWRRAFPPFRGLNAYWPKVSVHVPAHAEPPDMVLHTLAALRRLDYPNYEVIMIDDNTDQDELWRPVVDFCHQVGFKVFHLKNYPGFKSGALNFALSQTAPEAEIIAVVDSDYQVAPNFLRETVPYFQDPALAFLQTPQAFSNSDENLFAHQSALAQQYFFEVSMRSRNEGNAIIFCGTMGLIRRRVLESIGGWDGWCITEDAEASLRILKMGYEGAYVHHPYGRGLLPTTFHDAKKQRFRWAFGGMQILRRHHRSMIPLPGAGGGISLTLRQRISYLMGLLGWCNDLLVLVFTVFLLLTAAALVMGWEMPVRQLAEWILLVPVLSVASGTVRVAWALRRTTRCGWRDGVAAFASMVSFSWTVAQACLAAVWRDKGAFLRTPKFPAQADLSRALRAASAEAVLGILLLSAVPMVLNVRPTREGILLSLLLAWHGWIYLSALRSSLLEVVPLRHPASRAGGSAAPVGVSAP